MYFRVTVHQNKRYLVAFLIFPIFGGDHLVFFLVFFEFLGDISKVGACFRKVTSQCKKSIPRPTFFVDETYIRYLDLDGSGLE